MKKSICKLSILCTIILLCLTGCSKAEANKIYYKLDSEIEYVQDLIFKIANKIAKNEYIEDDKINWNYIQNDVLNVNDSWSILVLDLTEVNVTSENIISFSNDLNNTLIAVNQEDENLLIEKLSNMSQKLNVFKEAYSNNKNNIEKNKIKTGMLSVFSKAYAGNYTLAKDEVNKLIENYKILMNDKSYADENTYQLNKIYILLEEYLASIGTENFDLIRIKYLSAVENI